MDQQQPNPTSDQAPEPRPQSASPGTPLPGSIRLFRALGVDVYLHFSWLIVALVEFYYRRGQYNSLVWNVAEYVTLFAIVLLHEYGHALACRSVGGIANRILLWPLGGIAFVQPPQRAGAMLWSIAAGPLVNVALVPVTVGIWFMARRAGLPYSHRDAFHFLEMVALINVWLLVLNMLPFYPLDGGQVLRSLLWFAIGRAKSLLVASIIGMVGVAALGVVAIVIRDWLLIFIVIFLGMQCLNGFRQATMLAKAEAMPRHLYVRCPACGASPPMAPAWRCEACFFAADLIAHGGRCPHCGHVQRAIACPDCRSVVPLSAWGLAPPQAPGFPVHFNAPGWLPPGPPSNPPLRS